MTRLLQYVIAIVSGALLFSDAHGQTCSAPEFSPSQLGPYNRLVCEGVELQRKGEFSEAFVKLEKASKEPFDESVNFDLFPRLAILGFHMGNYNTYRDYMLRSKYALEILYGVIKCDTDPDEYHNAGFEEQYARGVAGLIRNRERIEGPMVEEMFYHMCAGTMWGVYKPPTDLDEFLDDDIVRLYREALSLGAKLIP